MLQVRKSGLITDGVFKIFRLLNLTGSTIALGSTQPITEMNTRNISWWVKTADAKG